MVVYQKPNLVQGFLPMRKNPSQQSSFSRHRRHPERWCTCHPT